jgi:hypothetical protein
MENNFWYPGQKTLNLILKTIYSIAEKMAEVGLKFRNWGRKKQRMQTAILNLRFPTDIRLLLKTSTAWKAILWKAIP